MPRPTVMSERQAALVLGCDPKTLPLRGYKTHSGYRLQLMYPRKDVLLMAQRLKAGKPPTRDG